MSRRNPQDEARVDCIDVDGLPVFVFNIPLDPELPVGLTPAEREVVLQVLAGASNAEIAEERGTAVQSVANHLNSIFDKLDISSRSELIAMVYTTNS